jgi:hypothetical protein
MDEKHTVNSVVLMEMDHSGIRGRYAKVGLAGMPSASILGPGWDRRNREGKRPIRCFAWRRTF